MPQFGHILECNDETSFCSFREPRDCLAVLHHGSGTRNSEAVSGSAQDSRARREFIPQTCLRRTSRATRLSVQIAGRATPTPFGFGGWLAMTRCPDGTDVMMGDLVLTQGEVN